MQDIDALVLGAGTALIGKFGIDQTTPGTTNKIAVDGTKETAIAQETGAVGAIGWLSSIKGFLDNLRTYIGAIDIAIVAAGAAGSVSAKLRRVTQGLEDLKTTIVLAASTAVIGWVSIKRVPVTTNTTGTGAALATLSPGAAFRLIAVRVNISTGAPLAAAETLTITADINAGAAYDTLLYDSDLGTAGINDAVVEFPDSSAYAFAADDDIVIALSANVGGDTWGCQTIHELI